MSKRFTRSSLDEHVKTYLDDIAKPGAHDLDGLDPDLFHENASCREAAVAIYPY